MKILWIATAVLLAVAAGLGGYLYLAPGQGRFAPCESGSVAGGKAAIGGPFTLVNQNGETVTEQDVIDGLTLVYFGYTYCPDICPFDMARNAEATDLLEQRGIMVKPVMITVDPARDTPGVLGGYVEAMHPRAVGLTGSEEQIEAVKKAYRVYGARASDDENYLVDHTTLTYLMAPEHGLLTFFRRDADAQDLADKVACYADRL
jgi:protein SCO1/2